MIEKCLGLLRPLPMKERYGAQWKNVGCLTQLEPGGCKPPENVTD